MSDQTRKYGENLSFIRPDHVNRYMFAAERVQKLRVLDLACGCGYGSWILHGAGNQVVGEDIAQDAIDYAKRYYQGPEYICAKAEDVTGEWDVLVSFETLEHLRDPLPVLRHVVGGLAAADTVVTAGIVKLRDSAPVRVANAPSSGQPVGKAEPVAARKGNS